MKKFTLLLLIITLLAISTAGCVAGDPLPEDFYTTNIYPGSTNTYAFGSDSMTWQEGYFYNLHTTNDFDVIGTATVQGDITVGGDGVFYGTSLFYDQVTLDEAGEVWREFVADLDWANVQANGVPTHVIRGIFDGFSLPIFAADNEELYYELKVPLSWKGPAWTKLDDVGDKPGGMAVYGGKLYIPMEGDDNVWVYDGSTLQISGNVGDRPVYATAHNGYLYVSCYGDDTVWVYDGVSWSKSGDIGAGPLGMVSDGTDLYVACLSDDAIWRLSGGVWAIDPALGLGGAAGIVGTQPNFMAVYGGDIYVGCCGADDDVWIRNAGAWAKDADVGGDPQEFQEYGGDLYLNCYTDDTVWSKSGGVWAVVTNILATQGNAPIGLTEFNDHLYSACKDSVWSDYHVADLYAAPFWNVNSDFTISGADEPMFLTEYEGKLYCACYASDTIWVYESETAIITIHVWLDTAQAAAIDAFRLEIAHENFTPDADTVPTTSEDVITDTVTGVVAQHHSFAVHMPLDMTDVDVGDSVAVRLRRIASADEIAGEVVVQHFGIEFKCDKLGGATP